VSVVLERALDGVATAELSLSLYLSTHSLLGRPDCDYLHVFSPTLHPKTTLNQSPTAMLRLGACSLERNRSGDASSSYELNRSHSRCLRVFRPGCTTPPAVSQRAFELASAQQHTAEAPRNRTIDPAHELRAHGAVLALVQLDQQGRGLEVTATCSSGSCNCVSMIARCDAFVRAYVPRLKTKSTRALNWLSFSGTVTYLLTQSSEALTSCNNKRSPSSLEMHEPGP